MPPMILDGLPAWSRSIDPRLTIDYGQLAPIALAFLALSPTARRDLIEQYHRRYCFPGLDLERASALYLFFRILFKLPHNQPRAHTKVFGGWLHPSIDAALPDYDLSWPVTIDDDQGSLMIARFTGYSGKGYDALSEYDYFAGLFPVRDIATLGRLVGP